MSTPSNSGDEEDYNRWVDSQRYCAAWAEDTAAHASNFRSPFEPCSPPSRFRPPSWPDSDSESDDGRHEPSFYSRSLPSIPPAYPIVSYPPSSSDRSSSRSSVVYVTHPPHVRFGPPATESYWWTELASVDSYEINTPVNRVRSFYRYLIQYHKPRREVRAFIDDLLHGRTCYADLLFWNNHDIECTYTYPYPYHSKIQSLLTRLFHNTETAPRVLPLLRGEQPWDRMHTLRWIYIVSHPPRSERDLFTIWNFIDKWDHHRQYRTCSARCLIPMSWINTISKLYSPEDFKACLRHLGFCSECHTRLSNNTAQQSRLSLRHPLPTLSSLYSGNLVLTPSRCNLLWPLILWLSWGHLHPSPDIGTFLSFVKKHGQQFALSEDENAWLIDRLDKSVSHWLESFPSPWRRCISAFDEQDWEMLSSDTTLTASTVDDEQLSPIENRITFKLHVFVWLCARESTQLTMAWPGPLQHSQTVLSSPLLQPLKAWLSVINSPHSDFVSHHSEWGDSPLLCHLASVPYMLLPTTAVTHPEVWLYFRRCLLSWWLKSTTNKYNPEFLGLPLGLEHFVALTHPAWHPKSHSSPVSAIAEYHDQKESLLKCLCAKLTEHASCSACGSNTRSSWDVGRSRWKHICDGCKSRYSHEYQNLSLDSIRRIITLDTYTLCALVITVLEDEDSYKSLLSRAGKEAQALIDTLHELLDSLELNTRVRSLITRALVRLVKRTNLHPECLALSEMEHIASHPVAAGSFGDVHQGTISGQQVSVKIVRLYQDKDVKKLVQVFYLEAILWNQLSHPNILPFYGVYYLGTDPIRVCLVSPWMSHGNVVQFLKKEPNANLLRLASDVAHGMNYLHQNKIVHGDLKGDNILVTAGHRACIMDFGLSSMACSKLPKWTSSSRAAHGTTRWQAPELFLGGSNTRAADIYAFACVCYEIFAGCSPFAELPNEMAAVLKVMSGERPSRPASPQLSDAMWTLVELCWGADISGRPDAEFVASYMRDLTGFEIATSEWDESFPRSLRSSLRSRSLIPSLEDLRGFFADQGVTNIADT